MIVICFYMILIKVISCYKETNIDNNVLFDNLNLDIYRGDRIAFVGKNGCGKTTLTKIINGELNFKPFYLIH